MSDPSTHQPSPAPEPEESAVNGGVTNGALASESDTGMNGKNGSDGANGAAHTNGAAPPQAVHDGLPPGPRLPMALQTLAMRTRQRPFLERARRKYGPMITGRIVGLGPTVIVSDPELIKTTFRADPKVLHAGSQSPLRTILGRHSLLGIDEQEHMEQRKLLLPPFKGQRMRAYESMIAEVAAEEIDSWPQDVELSVARPMQRITLRAILRAIFGAEGAHQESLEEMLPRWTVLGTRLVLAPGSGATSARGRRGRASGSSAGRSTRCSTN